MNTSAATVHLVERDLRLSVPPHARTAALRAALVTETRIAEALAQRSRGMLALVERLAQQALAESADIPEARQRLDGLCRSMRGALASGETATEGDLRALAEETLGAFDMAAGPRILIEGPAVALDPEARRLVSLALFDLASRSERYGALGLADGRVALAWTAEAGGGLRLTWREFGARPAAELLRRGSGGALQALLADSFGAPLRERAAPFGLVAELFLPARVVRDPAAPTPRRVLVAVADRAAAVTLTALLLACGVGEVGAAPNAAEASDALAAGGVDLLCVDDATAEALPQMARAPVLVVAPTGAAARTAGPVLRLPTSATRLAEAMASVMGATRSAGYSLT